MFTTERRDHVRDRVLGVARSDPRVTAGARTGSTAVGSGDAWSDIDLAFGVADGVSLAAVFDDWTALFEHEFGLLHHWDLSYRSSLYRVFLLPDGLEVDVSLTPQGDFGPRGPHFRPLFGEARPLQPAPPPDPRYLIGLGWHHVFRARASIERGQPWRAEYWISGIRDNALALACLRLGERAVEARGIDRLPASVTNPFVGALVRALDAGELRRALAVATAGLIGELEAWDATLAALLTPTLREFGARPAAERAC